MLQAIANDPARSAIEAARWIASALREAIAARGSATLAISGGSTPRRMLQALAHEALPWPQLRVIQVDERIAPADDPRRNLLMQRAALIVPGALPPAQLFGMPVESPDLAAAAASYAPLCESIDVLHLGLGDDGHTASMVPGDPLLKELTQWVGISQPYQGTRRMTLTFAAINRARRIVWLVSGTAKREPLAQLLAGKGDIPALQVRRGAAVVFADSAALGDAAVTA